MPKSASAPRLRLQANLAVLISLAVATADPTRLNATRIARFGAYEADQRNGELRKSGMRLRIGVQPFQVLTVLLEKQGDVVSREELREKIWPSGTFVDFENGLNKAVAKLRAVLNDDPGNPRFIETVPRRGYRFVAQVEFVEIKADGEAGGPHLPLRKGRRVRLIMASAALLVLAAGVVVAVQKPGLFGSGRLWRRGSPIQSLAVLPLENLSGDPGQEYFVDGMTDELITSLSKIRSVRVASRTSVLHLKGTKKTLPEIARELNVDAVVEGSVSRVGDQIRIRTQLIRGANDEHLWAASYTTSMQDIQGAQVDIAQQVASEIQGRLTPQQKLALAGPSRSTVPEAYDAYLKGRYQFNLWSREGFQKSCTFFEQAIQSDPAYAPGYAGMADCYTALSSLRIMPPGEAIPKAKAMARKAIELDDTLAEAHAVLGTALLNYDWDWPAAYAELEKAADLDPDNSATHLRLLSYYKTVGRIDDAVREAKLAQKLDPVSRQPYSSLAWLYINSGQYENAAQQLQKCLELDPSFQDVHFGLFLVYNHEKAFSRAIDEIVSQARVENDAQAVENVPRIYREKGYQPAKKYYLELSLNNYLKNKDVFGAAIDYALLGNNEKALDYLELLYRQKSNYVIQIKVNAYFEGLHQEPRFQQLLQRLRLAD
jgi:TolB-like protein/DNA-binding winged helix-turn-helix (wHTH) protein/Tfp pilus assembly protein PilF